MELSDRHIGPYLYPAGFPLLLTPVLAITGRNYIALKVPGLIFFLLSLWFVYLLFRYRFTQKLWLYLLLISLAFNRYFMFFSDAILSDIPHLFFAISSIYFIDRYRKSGNFIQMFTLGLLLTFAYLIRSPGILVLATYAIIHIIDDYKLIINLKINYFKQYFNRLIPYAVFVGGVLLHESLYLQGEGNHYQLLFKTSPTIFIQNLVYYLGEFRLVLVTGFPAIAWISLILSIPFVTIGIIHNVRKNAIFLIYIGLNLLLFAAWPEREGLRFMIPLIPFYFFFLIAGISKATVRFPITAKPAALVFSVFILSQFINCYLHDLRTDLSTNVFADSTTEMFDYIADHSKKTDIVAFNKPRTLRLMTGRNSISMASPEKDAIRKVDWIVSRRDLEKDFLVKVFSNEKYRIYKILKKVN